MNLKSSTDHLIGKIGLKSPEVLYRHPIANESRLGTISPLDSEHPVAHAILKNGKPNKISNRISENVAEANNMRNPHKDGSTGSKFQSNKRKDKIIELKKRLDFNQPTREDIKKLIENQSEIESLSLQSSEQSYTSRRVDKLGRKQETLFVSEDQNSLSSKAYQFFSFNKKYLEQKSHIDKEFKTIQDFLYKNKNSALPLQYANYNILEMNYEEFSGLLKFKPKVEFLSFLEERINSKILRKFPLYEKFIPENRIDNGTGILGELGYYHCIAIFPIDINYPSYLKKIRHQAAQITVQRFSQLTPHDKTEFNVLKFFSENSTAIHLNII